MKIPFDIKYRDKIESGKYKVKTRDGCPVRIICWDRVDVQPVVALISGKDGTEFTGEFTIEGNYWLSKMESHKDLFVVIQDPEMSKFEKAVSKYRPQSDTLETIQRIAAELLSLARNEFNKQIENDYREIIHNAYEKGKTDTLRDLPRWKIWSNGACGNSEGYPIALVHRGCGFNLVSTLGIDGEKYIMLSDLEKLPGFKEENHE